PTPARRFRIRVVEDEPAADEGGVVIERRSLNELIALRVDKHLRAFSALEDVIAVSRRGLPRERVAQTRAAARLDSDAQTTVGQAVFCGHLFDQRGGVFTDFKHLGDPGSDGFRTYFVRHIYDQNSPILVAEGISVQARAQLK